MVTDRAVTTGRDLNVRWHEIIEPACEDDGRPMTYHGPASRVVDQSKSILLLCAESQEKLGIKEDRVMKRNWLVAGLTLVLIWVVPGMAQAASCSCTAPDGSCAAICGNDGACSAQCSGGSSDDPEPLEPAPLQAPVGDTEAIQAELPDEVGDRLVDLRIQDAPGKAISEALQNLTGLAIEFRTQDPTETLTLDASNIPVRDLLGLLATRGAVAVRGTRATWHPPLEDALRETKVTLSVERARAADVVAMLADILGAPMDFEPTVENSTVTVDVKNAPVGEVLSILRQFGNITGPGLDE